MTSATSKDDRQETNRLLLQDNLDQAKSLSQRNVLGQFATPSPLAHEILQQAKKLLRSTDPIRFLDPAIGTGAFFSALRQVFRSDCIHSARGYEIDDHYGIPASDLWRDSGLDLRIEDFTYVSRDSAEQYDLVICNPPYVRHHYLTRETKAWLRARVRAETGWELSGLAGLYCYFMLLSHRWMARSALAGWLVPSEFMDVNYGSTIKNYLLDNVTLIGIHRFSPADVQFGDALVSSAVVWFRNESPPAEHSVKMSFGGSLLKPKRERTVSTNDLRNAHKWTPFPSKSNNRSSDVPRLSEFFMIKRGLVTGDNKFFILSEDEVNNRELPWSMFRPILPSPRNLDVDEIQSDEAQNPLLNSKLFLLDCRLSVEEIRVRYPTLWVYLEEGRERGVADRYVCRHRTPWYSQESRPAAPLMCTYLGRQGNNKRMPFRFILNRSRATAANVYLMLYPSKEVTKAISNNSTILERVWHELNRIDPEDLLSEGRVYGGGLHKLEPRELANVPLAALGGLFPSTLINADHEGLIANPPIV